MIITKLFVCYDPAESSQFCLLTTIEGFSKFKTLPWWNKIKDGSTHTAEVQLKAMTEMMGGWQRNGPWPRAKFRIDQVDKYTGEPV